MAIAAARCSTKAARWRRATPRAAPGRCRSVLRRWAQGSGAALSILRVPGIYAAERLPLKRLREGTPALAEADDVYTNHIHADDLAAIIARALFRALLQPYLSRGRRQ
jgi:nucleoside-diphosphate-sugar epimerase